MTYLTHGSKWCENRSSQDATWGHILNVGAARTSGFSEKHLHIQWPPLLQNQTCSAFKGLPVTSQQPRFEPCDRWPLCCTCCWTVQCQWLLPVAPWVRVNTTLLVTVLFFCSERKHNGVIPENKDFSYFPTVIPRQVSIELVFFRWYLVGTFDSALKNAEGVPCSAKIPLASMQI